MKQAIKWSYCIWCDKSTSLSSLKTVRFVELSSHISSYIEDLSEILSAYFSGEKNLFSGLKHSQWCEILREKKTVQNSWMNFPISYLFDVFCGILNQRKEQELVWKHVKAWNDTLRYMYDTISDREKLHQRICMEPRGFTSFDVN